MPTRTIIAARSFSVHGGCPRHVQLPTSSARSQLANALAGRRVCEGDCVGTLLEDYRHLELYYAVSCMGAVLHTVNPRLFPEQVEYIINHAEDRLLFIDRRCSRSSRSSTASADGAQNRSS